MLCDKQINQKIMHFNKMNIRESFNGDVQHFISGRQNYLALSPKDYYCDNTTAIN